MFNIESKINMHAKLQKKINHSQEKIQSLLTEPDMTESKDQHTGPLSKSIINMKDILKDIKETMNIIGRETEDNFLNTQMEHVEKKKIINLNKYQQNLSKRNTKKKTEKNLQEHLRQYQVV